MRSLIAQVPSECSLSFQIIAPLCAERRRTDGLSCRMRFSPGRHRSTIAEQVGYQSEAAFSKAFKRQNRQSPGEYRESKH
ncbi:hypothetical protein [Nostoc sp.]|uniref:hypothetical protein n=1 Tax=Nostoc sp. TaxID=1180 RepID=UPI002FF48CE2